ncbi:MAG: beta-lactamase family protein [Flavobacteriaceae bacterium]|nr:beta-lactamase family protein [Flavobacteriaceae bacterium]
MKKINLIKLFTVVLFCFLSFGYSQNLTSKIDALLETKFKNNGPGATALVSKGGKVIYRKAFGKSNLELDVPMIPENVFQIGSMTKQFTAVSILMLLEQGKLALNDDITTFIPDYPTHNKNITIHHLLTHTSGIKSYTSMRGLRDIARKDLEPLELIDFFKNEPMDFNPGEEYKYNNSGYIILGYIIEKVSGISYAEFVDTNIFKKINMSSSLYGSKSKIIKNRASGYQKRSDYRNTTYISLTLPYAAGSIMSTVDDLLKWQQAISNNTLLQPETIKKAFTNYTLTNGTKINYGYGWNINDIKGTSTIEHGGSIFGFKSMGVYIPTEDVYVIVLSNCDCNSPTTTALKIAALAIDKPFPEINNAVTLTSTKLEQWVGTYEYDNGVIRHLKLIDSQLYSQREGGSDFKVYPISENRFSLEDGLSELIFSNTKDTKKVQFKSRIKSSFGTEKVLK